MKNENIDMELELYKDEVYQKSVHFRKVPPKAAERLMTEHETYFRQYKEDGLEPCGAAAGIATNLL